MGDFPNLHVMVMKSMCSKGYVTEKFSWMWHYYFLSNEGIEYLREFLHLPETVFPSTLTKQRPSKPVLRVPTRPVAMEEKEKVGARVKANGRVMRHEAFT